ncbi:MAG TPA: hypothetical protein VGM88_11645 [Kofleriaceae bacterium]|jgi:hypothetical protein
MNDYDIIIGLDWCPNPLTGIEDREHTLHLGVVSIAKASATYSVYFERSINQRTAFVMRDYKTTNKTAPVHLSLVIFQTGDVPDYYFVGWVRPENHELARGWVDFLNSEINHRRAGRASAETLPGKGSENAKGQLTEHRSHTER